MTGAVCSPACPGAFARGEDRREALAKMAAFCRRTSPGPKLLW